MTPISSIVALAVGGCVSCVAVIGDRLLRGRWGGDADSVERALPECGNGDAGAGDAATLGSAVSDLDPSGNDSGVGHAGDFDACVGEVRRPRAMLASMLSLPVASMIATIRGCPDESGCTPSLGRVW